MKAVDQQMKNIQRSSDLIKIKRYVHIFLHRIGVTFFAIYREKTVSCAYFSYIYPIENIEKPTKQQPTKIFREKGSTQEKI
jgi:hypothetical protein